MLIDYVVVDNVCLTKCKNTDCFVGDVCCAQCEHNEGQIIGQKVGNINKIDCSYEGWGEPDNQSFEYYEKKVIEWGERTGLNEKSSIDKQLLKSMEELGELCGAVLRGKTLKTIDGFGDVLVTLILAHNHFSSKNSIVDCLEIAYDEIKDRTGKMINGNFVKDE